VRGPHKRGLCGICHTCHFVNPARLLHIYRDSVSQSQRKWKMSEIVLDCGAQHNWVHPTAKGAGINWTVISLLAVDACTLGNFIYPVDAPHSRGRFKCCLTFAMLHSMGTHALYNKPTSAICLCDNTLLLSTFQRKLITHIFGLCQ